MKRRTFFSIVTVSVILITVLSVSVSLLSPQALVPSKCKRYGVLPKTELLTSYTVKPGDSLLSIAKNELGDTSRAGELAEINQESYPGLSLRYPFLEVGWKLGLPPKDLRIIGGELKTAAGEIITTGSTWGVYWPNSGVGSFNSNFPQGFKVGACVIVSYTETISSTSSPEYKLLYIKNQ